MVGTGLLGKKCVKLWSKKHDVHYTWRSKDHFNEGDSYKLDITNKKRFEELVSKISPDAVVLTAAFTDVDGCEENPEKAFEVNAEAPGKIAEICSREEIGLVYISTDYVFDGEKGSYTETDTTNPVNVYGKSKLDGEQKVMQNHPGVVIARTSVIFGWERPNFATWVLDSLESGEEIPVVNDKYISPTLNTDLSNQLEELIAEKSSGIFHTAGKTKISFYGFAKLLAEKAGHDTDLINRAKTGDLSWKAKRPRDSSLDTTRIKEIVNPMTLEDSIGLLLSQKGVAS